MKSVKPGRGPSMMGGVMGIFMVVFGIVWTIAAAGMGAPFFFPLFGICWTAIAAIQCIYNFRNATGKNRYSTFDIVDSSEETDPFNERFGMSREEREMRDAVAAELKKEGTTPGYYTSSADKYDDGIVESRFCPFCGAEVLQGFEFCNKCGKKLP